MIYLTYHNMKKLFFIFIYLNIVSSILFSGAIYSDVVKAWEIDNTKIFDPTLRTSNKGRVLPPEGKIHPRFSPSVVIDKLFIASDAGFIKVVNTNTKKVKPITRLPVIIEEGELYGWNNIFLYGKHRRNRRYYHSCIDLRAKRLKGIIKQTGRFWKIKDFAIYCENNELFIVSPMKGRVVYTQEIDSEFTHYVKNSRKKHFLFYNEDYELIELILPEWAIALLFATTQPQKGERKKEILNFRKLAQLDETMTPHYFHKKKVYYHTENSIAALNTKKNQLLWETPIAEPYTTVKAPLVTKKNLIYLVSDGLDSNKNNGKIMAINPDSGKIIWSTEPFQFAKFDPIEFHKMIVHPDNDGNIIFRNTKSGREAFKFDVGGTFATPYIEDEALYIVTSEKLIRFDFKY
jgi:hypothetical protein